MEDCIMSHRNGIASQLKGITLALSYGANPEQLRNDPKYKDIWLTAKNEPIAVNAMELSHMCFTVGLWLRKEFENNEKVRLGLIDPEHCRNGLASPYGTVEEWLNKSCSIRDTPALASMLSRISTIEGGTQLLECILKNNAIKGLNNVHDVVMIDQLVPAFF